MTELNIAYNTTDLMNDDLSKISDDMNDYQQQQPQQQQQQPQQQLQQPQQQLPPQQPQLPPQLPSQPTISHMTNYYPSQPIPRNQYKQPQRTPEYSFWDRMTLSRNDVFKLILLSFVIVLGISIEKFFSHYITLYLSDNILSSVQEFLFRLSYPILIFLLIWIIKSL